MSPEAAFDPDNLEIHMATLYLTEQYSVVKIEGEALRVQIIPTPRLAFGVAF